MPSDATSRVLVTGATGFTGGHLARALAARGERVRVLVRDGARAGDLAATPGIEVCVGDLKDPAARTRAVDRVVTVYNIAAIYRQAGVPASEYRAVNTEAVAELVWAAARAGARRVVHCSTVGVHGDVEHPPANEDAPLRPGDVYQETKLEGERAAREAAQAAGIELVEGFRLCGTVPAAAGRTYILAGGEVGTLTALVGLVAEEAGVNPPSLHL